MRADALRNREQILRAARDVFVDQGADAPLEEIARRAGVGIATLYRRFPERADLVRGVAEDIFQALAAAVEGAEAEEADALSALRRFAHAALDLRVGAVMPALVGRVGFDGEFERLRRAVGARVDALLARAQEAGLVRADIAFGDVVLLIARLSRPLPGPFDRSADADFAHRHLDLCLDGLAVRPAADRPLTGPRLGVEVLDRIKETIEDRHRAVPETDRPRPGPEHGRGEP
jgi:AcrR family transcriptional regulator